MYEYVPHLLHEKWQEWCQTPRGLWQTPVQDQHGCWSQDREFLARGRAGRLMWTQRTGERLWNCSLSRKNKRPAVGNHCCRGGKRQLEGSPVYRSTRRWVVRSPTVRSIWPFDPNAAPPPSPIIAIIHTCVKAIIKSCLSAASPSFCHLSQKVLQLPVQSGQLALKVRRRCAIKIKLLTRKKIFFCWVFFLFIALWNKLSFVCFHLLCPLAVTIAWIHNSISTANIWFVNQFTHRIEQIVRHVDSLSGTISN